MNLLSLHFTMKEPAGLVAVYTVYGKKNVIRVYQTIIIHSFESARKEHAS